MNHNGESSTNNEMLCKGYNEYGLTPLHIAVEGNNIDEINSQLNSAADVNALTKNEDGFSPLHIAAKNGQLDIVKTLIMHKANGFIKDKYGRTPFQLAGKNNHLDVYEYLVQTLQDNVIEVKFNSTEGTRSASGQNYEINLLILLLLEGKRRVKNGNLLDFFLATNMEETGDFDDANMKYSTVTRNGDIETRILLIQGKHKENPEKEIVTYERMFPEDSDFFLLRKHFVNYREVKKIFNESNNHPMFKHSFDDCEMIFFTNAIFNFETHPKGMDKKVLCREDILYLGEEYNNEYFEINFLENRDKVVDYLQYSSDCKRLAKELADTMFSSKGIDVDKGLSKKYHTSLASDVIEKLKTKEGSIRRNFLNDHKNNQFRQSLFEELQKMNEFKHKSQDDIETTLINRIIRLPNSFGNVKEKHIKLELPEDRVSEEEIQNFLKKLKIYPSRPNDSQLREIIKYRIEMYFNLEEHDAETMYAEIKDKIERWWLCGNCFLTMNNDYFDSFIFKDQLNVSVYFEVKEPNRLYIGRKDELETVRKLLQNYNKIVVITSSYINMTEGIGKSELASKYLQENSKYYDNNIIWIDAGCESIIGKSFRRLAEDKLRISTKSNSEYQRNTINIVKNILNFFREKKCIFIFDNACNHEYFINILSVFEHQLNKKMQHILITSRDKDWSAHVEVLKIRPLHKDGAVEYFHKNLGVKADEMLEKIEGESLIGITECHPLAIQRVVDYIDYQNVTEDFTISHYIKKYLENVKASYSDVKSKNRDFEKSSFSFKFKVISDMWNITQET